MEIKIGDLNFSNWLYQETLNCWTRYDNKKDYHISLDMSFYNDKNYLKLYGNLPNQLGLLFTDIWLSDGNRFCYYELEQLEEIKEKIDNLLIKLSKMWSFL